MVEVKIFEVDVRSTSMVNAENKLASLLNDNWAIVGQSEGQGCVTWTLIRHTAPVKIDVNGPGLHQQLH